MVVNKLFVGQVIPQLSLLNGVELMSKGLRLLDPTQAIEVFFTKWVIHDQNLENQTCKAFLGTNLGNINLAQGGKWLFNFKWRLQCMKTKACLGLPYGVRLEQHQICKGGGRENPMMLQKQIQGANF